MYALPFAQLIPLTPRDTELMLTFPFPGYHGQPKPRRTPNNFWTYRYRRGGFGYKLWKKWFNDQSMNRFEARLRNETLLNKRVKDGKLRYDFRELEVKEVNTRMMRYGTGPRSR